MRLGGLENVDVEEADGSLWARQRAGQRSAEQAVVRVGARASELARVLAATDGCGGALVARAALGVSYIALEPSAIEILRERLPRRAISVPLDLPWYARDSIDPWPAAAGPALELMRRVKQRFDPPAICNPGVFVGGI